MKIVAPRSFTYEASNRAVLLLHGFTSSTNDVKMLGRHLQAHGYTCHAPLYNGHGDGPDELIQTGPTEWWNDVREGYRYLTSEGYKEIAVAGISMGGVFALRLAGFEKVQAVISMSAPILKRNTEDLFKRVLGYAKRFKKLEGKSDEQIMVEINELADKRMDSLAELQKFIVETDSSLKKIASPVFVLQGCLDDLLYKESSDIIFNTVDVENKQIQWYEDSGHMMTIGSERKQINEDVRKFLDSIEWESDVNG
ncbi:esterase [Bacillus freudenreichii]|nr:esterase [Bacillus freudenreichii]